MPSISRTAGSMASKIITCDSKTVHKKEISELAKKVSTVQNKVKEFKTKSKMDPEALGSFFRERELKSQGPVIKREILKCLKEVKILKEKMESTSYAHAISKHKNLEKMGKMLAKDIVKLGVNSKTNNERETYNQMMVEHEKNAKALKGSRPVREKGEYNGGM